MYPRIFENPRPYCKIEKNKLEYRLLQAAERKRLFAPPAAAFSFRNRNGGHAGRKERISETDRRPRISRAWDKTMIKAVIFDMDGVIVDSEIVYMDYLLDFARTKNPDATMESLNPMVGLSRKDSWSVMAAAVKNGQPWEELRDEFSKLDIYSRVDYRKIFRPEAKTVTEELKKRGYLVALASSTGPKLIGRIMDETGMRQEFDLIVSGAQFKQSKPNPEIYHHTAAELGVPESECFVIEDSTVGIQAAKAAGMKVAALRDDRFGFDQSLADYHVDRLTEVLQYL